MQRRIGILRSMTAIAAVAMLVVLTPASAGAVEVEAGHDNWVLFGFGGQGSFVSETYTFSGKVFVDVLDCCLRGDEFVVFNNGQSLGPTSEVPEDGLQCGADPDVCILTHSYRRYTLADGSHAITIMARRSPFGSGAVWIRVLART